MRYAVLATFALGAGCVATATPRFPDDVAAALAHHSMRRLDTDELIVYYPAERQEEAVRVARQITTCLTAARGHAPRGGRPRVVMPDLPLNNAFVLPEVAGYEDIAVVPTYNTLDFVTEFGLPPDPGHVGCHEITHYVHAQQIAGFWKAVNAVFGEVLTPQLGLDVWFWEGLATYYEQQGGAGRLNWPVWNELFDAAYAGRGVDGDDFSELGRRASVGHHYLVGSHFIEWLIDTYGEDRLWEVVARQAHATAFLLDVNGRFRRAYGKSLSRLIGEFSRAVRQKPRPAVPAGQIRLRTIGDQARYARGPDGSEAVVAGDVDVPVHLDVRGPDGKLRTSVNLTDVIVPRKLVVASPLLVSGMAFAADGTLYLTVIDLGTTYETTRLLRVRPGGDLDVIRTGLGPGMTVSPDGARYWAAEVDGDAWGLAEVDLETRARKVVIAPEPGRYVLRVALSPKGDRALVSEWDGRRFEVSVYATGDTWTRQRVLAGAPTAPAYDASWIDDDRAMYLAPVEGRFQVWVESLSSGNRTTLTAAPFGAFQPAAAGGTVRFLDRDGWAWHLSEVALPAPEPAPAPVPADTTIRIEAPGAIAGGGLPFADVEVHRDRPYSLLDGLFVPQLHALALAQPLDATALFGLGLAGGDHLGYQRWAVMGVVDVSPKPVRFGWSAGYSNAMLAPWVLAVSGQDLRWHHGIDDDPEMAGFERYSDRDALDAAATVGRVFRGTTSAALSAVYTRDDFADDPTPYRRLGGAQLSFRHDSAEATRYGGLRRRLALALDGARYPERFSTIGALWDGRAEAMVTVPVLGTRRHALHLDLRHRALRGPDVPLLLISGGPYTSLWQQRSPDLPPPTLDDPLLPERLRFTEPLRGFEDLEFAAARLSAAELAWRYPIPIDAGWATSLSVFPAILLRELDLELFGTAARIDADDHLAAGAALTTSLYFWRVPLLIRYQAARRFTDDEAWAQEVGIAVGL